MASRGQRQLRVCASQDDDLADLADLGIEMILRNDASYEWNSPQFGDRLDAWNAGRADRRNLMPQSAQPPEQRQRKRLFRFSVPQRF